AASAQTWDCGESSAYSTDFALNTDASMCDGVIAYSGDFALNTDASMCDGVIAYSGDFALSTDASACDGVAAYSSGFALNTDTSACGGTGQTSLAFAIDTDQSTCTGRTDPTTDVLLDTIWSPGTIKRHPVGQRVTLAGLPVSRAFAERLYIEDRSKFSGIGAMPSIVAEPGRLATVTGTLAEVEGEIMLTSADVTLGEIGSAPFPIGMNSRALGGGDFFYDAVTGAGQRGITGAFGLNNIGLLVTICGRVTASGSYPRGSWFYIDDGSGVDDGTGVKGVYAAAPSSVTPPTEGAFVVVTGVSSCQYYNDKLVNTLLIRTQEDIVVAAEPEGVPSSASAASTEAKPPPRLSGR
ncbi:MAG: hypothetical protein Q7R41_17550, partial [Phycisphaerales bacterium]|nr:hypothetical protein [Phycisphaerales bacterium]